jgi:4-amino-4-deoxy-L-arabinose transferase-like glycosyltransferase
MSQTLLSNTAIMATMVAPLFWSGLTIFNTNPDGCLPRSGRHMHHTNCPSALPVERQRISEYLLANTEPNSYLVATLTAYDAALYILATGRPVLTLGGFTGNDNAVKVDELAQMVLEGRLQFVLDDRELSWKKPEIAAWLSAHCQREVTALYDCHRR